MNGKNLARDILLKKEGLEKIRMKCNMDCFNCIYPDCIIDEKDIQVEKRTQSSYYELNREKCLARSNEYNRTHREQRREYDRKRYEKNRERLKAIRREYYAEQKPIVDDPVRKDQKRKAALDYYYEHLEERKAYNRNYYQEHREYFIQKAKDRYKRRKEVAYD